MSYPNEPSPWNPRPDGAQAPGQQPGYGSAPGQQPGYGSAPGQQPGYGSAPGQQPGYGSAPGQQPGYGSAPGQNQYGAQGGFSNQTAYGSAPQNQYAPPNQYTGQGGQFAGQLGSQQGSGQLGSQQGDLSAGTPMPGGYGQGGHMGSVNNEPMPHVTPQNRGAAILGPLTLRDILLLVAALLAIIALSTPVIAFRTNRELIWAFQNSTLLAVLGYLSLVVAGILTVINKLTGAIKYIVSLSVDQVISVLACVSLVTNVLWIGQMLVRFLRIQSEIGMAPVLHIGAYVGLLAALLAFVAGTLTMIPIFGKEFAERPDVPAHPKARPFTKNSVYGVAAPGMGGVVAPGMGGAGMGGAPAQYAQGSAPGGMGSAPGMAGSAPVNMGGQPAAPVMSNVPGDAATANQPINQPANQPINHPGNQQSDMGGNVQGGNDGNASVDRANVDSAPNAASRRDFAGDFNRDARSQDSQPQAGEQNRFAPTQQPVSGEPSSANSGATSYQTSADEPTYLGKHSVERPRYTQSEPTQAFMTGGFDEVADQPAAQSAPQGGASTPQQDAPQQGANQQGTDQQDAPQQGTNQQGANQQGTDQQGTDQQVGQAGSDNPWMASVSGAAASSAAVSSVAASSAAAQEPEVGRRATDAQPHAGGGSSVLQPAQQQEGQQPAQQQQEPQNTEAAGESVAESAQSAPESSREPDLRGDEPAPSASENEPTQYFRPYDYSGEGFRTAQQDQREPQVADGASATTEPGAANQVATADAEGPVGPSQQFWFAVPEPRPAVDPRTGETVFMVTPGEWFLAAQDLGNAYVVHNSEQREGVLYDISGVMLP